MSTLIRNRSLAAALVVLNGLLVLLVVNGQILGKQQVIDSGKTVYLELAPVDPRSLMQGDYMVLGYALARDEELREAGETVPTRGRMILELDRKGRATFSRFEDEEAGDSLAENEVYLGYRKWRRGWRFGIESFFFQEGLGERYERAKFAELRVSESGVPVLLDLRGEKLQPLLKSEADPGES